MRLRSICFSGLDSRASKVLVRFICGPTADHDALRFTTNPFNLFPAGRLHCWSLNTAETSPSAQSSLRISADKPEIRHQLPSVHYDALEPLLISEALEEVDSFNAQISLISLYHLISTIVYSYHLISTIVYSYHLSAPKCLILFSVPAPAP
jgi:hypothetical protein